MVRSTSIESRLQNARPAEHSGSAGPSLPAAGRPPGARALPIWPARVALAAVALAVALVALLLLGPLVLPFRAYIVASGSMEPALRQGAVAIALPVAASDLRPGDVISFQSPRSPRQTVTHRIVALRRESGGVSAETKGDANPAPDSWILTLPGRSWREAFSIPLLGYLIAAAQAPAGRVLLVVAPGVALAWLYLADLIRPRRPW